MAEAYKPGDYIIKQGDQGDKFYMIDEGKIYASKNQSDGTETKVFEFKPGDYFGELALIKNVPRQANVIAEVSDALIKLWRRNATYYRWIKVHSEGCWDLSKIFWQGTQTDMINISRINSE